MYSTGLMQYHGFFASSAFTLAFKFVPTREHFVTSIGAGTAQNIEQQMREFVDTFSPLLQEIHAFFVSRA